MTRRIFSGAWLIDATGAEPRKSDIAVENGLIVDIGDSLIGDDYVQLLDQWVTPGFIDCHVHVMVENFDLMTIIETPFSMQFYVAARNLRKTLRAGITYARDTGGADLGVKRALELGYLDGPALQISINLMSMTGGHADHWGSCGYATPDFLEHPGRPDGVCDGDADVIRTTREMMRAGADFIKVCSTGGVLSPRDHPSHSQFLPRELVATVEAAAQADRVVAAHAQGSEGIKNAIRAGVWSIEHGSMIDDEGIDLMVKHGTFLVPTLSALEWIIVQSAGRRVEELEKARTLLSVQQDSVKKAVAAGVQIAMGSDAGVGPHGANLTELLRLVDCGMTPMEAIQAGTVVSARVLRLEHERGTLEVGKVADFVVLGENPLDDLDGLASGRTVKSVWQNGELRVQND